MDKQSLDFLRCLVETPSPSGFEQPAQRVFRDYVSRFADTVSTDVLGTVTAVQNVEGRPRVMIAGHCDQIGFIISHISDEGFLYFRRIGGIDPTACVSQRVVIDSKEGPVHGVVGRKAIHLQEPDDRTKAPTIESLWIDIGAENKADAEKAVRLGDAGVFVQNFRVLRDNRAVSMAFDNKMAIWIVAETMRLLKERPDRTQKLQAAVYGVATVQEEIGGPGASASSFNIDPDIAIVIDVGHATDHPGVEKTKAGDYSLDKGPILSRGANVNPVVFDRLCECAEDVKISYQTEAIGGRSATDADPIQGSRSGVAVGLIHVPLRYMHTPSEMISLTDMENTAKLLAEFVSRLNPQISFVPE
ncbi:MAG: M42 family metallopeptidase [Armatimonadetes bacterium]|nr:M42 family metallopeptidase [Armatimonadota bacterium]